MSEHAKKVELYEMNAPINLNIAKQRETNAILTDECTPSTLFILDEK